MKIQKNSKFQLTSETVQHWTGATLYRIKALKTFGNISKGDLGGFVEALKNLSEDGDAWVSGNARVYGNARVSGNARVFGNARVSGNAQVYGNARVYGDAWEESPLQIQGTKHFVNICAKGNLKIGCYELEIDSWLSKFEEIGSNEGYTKKQIKEYGLYIKLAKELSELE